LGEGKMPRVEVLRAENQPATPKFPVSIPPLSPVFGERRGKGDERGNYLHDTKRI
jgi:hypothetical protein